MIRKEAGVSVGGVSEGRLWLGFLECLSCLGFEFLDAFHGGQLLGHGAAEFLDGLADFGSDIAVGFVGLVLASDFLATEFFLGLGGAEEIGSEFGAAHMVENLLVFLQTLAAMDVFGSKTTVEPHVAMVLKDSVVARLNDPGILRGIRKLAIVRAQFGADGEAALFFDLSIAQFLPAGLDGEVGLALGDDFLGWISVLNDEVAGVARHHHGLCRSPRAFANFDHIGDLNEMIVHSLATVETGGAGGLDDGLEIPVIGIIEHFGEVPAGPELVARRVGAADGLEWRDLLAHGFRQGLRVSKGGVLGKSKRCGRGGMVRANRRVSGQGQSSHGNIS